MRSIPSQYIERAYLGLFIILIIAIPISKALASVAMGVLGGLSLIHLLTKPKQILPTFTAWPQIMALMLPFLFFGLSLLYTDDMRAGRKFWLMQNALFIVAGLVIVHAELLQRHYVLLLKTLIYTTSFTGMVTMLFYFLPEPQAIALAEFGQSLGMKEYILHTKREAFGVYSPFIVRLQQSNLISISILSAIWLMAKGKVSRNMLIWVVILFASSLVLGGRGGQIGLLAGLGIWLISWGIRKFSPRLAPTLGAWGARISIGVGSLVVLTLLPVAANYALPSVQERYNQLLWEIDTVYNGTYVNYDYVHFTGIRRIVSYQHTWEAITQNPILGVGVGDYQQTLEDIYAKDEFEFPVNGHNHLLFLWLNTGLIGLLAFLLGWTYWAYQILQKRSWDDSTQAVSIITFFLTIMMFDIMVTQIDTMIQPFIMGIIAVVANIKPSAAA